MTPLWLLGVQGLLHVITPKRAGIVISTPSAKDESLIKVSHIEKNCLSYVLSTYNTPNIGDKKEKYFEIFPVLSVVWN